MACEVSGHGEAGSSATAIEIKIKTMDSQTYTLQVDKQMPVPALKERIASVTGVVTEHQRLICRGKVLKDDQLLSAYHVEDGHTLHLVVRDPAAASSEGPPSDPAFDQSSTGTRGHMFQVAPGIVVETFNMPGQGDRGLSDVSRIVSAVLGSIGITNTGTGSEIRDPVAEVAVPGGTTQTSPEQSGVRNPNDMSGRQNAFGFPAAVSFGSLQAPVIPDALATLSQYLGHMRQEFLNSGRAGETNNGAAASQENDGGPSASAQSESVQGGLPSPASLAALLSATRHMLNQQTEECLLQLGRQLENQANMTDPVARVSAQSGAMRTGILLQNLGAYFLELGRTVTTLRLGRSASEAVVNAGPAVFISPSGPNPLMVQPLPFQPGASFGTPLSGTGQSGSGSINGLGAGFVPRRIDIQIRRVGPSTHQTEPSGTRQSGGQTPSSTATNGERPVNQPATGTSDTPSSNNGAGVRVLPFRTVMASVPDLNRSPSESSGASLGFLYPFLGRYPNVASGNVSSRTENQVSSENHGVQTQLQSTPESAANQQNVEDPSGNGRVPASSSGPRVSSRTIDINILSTGGISSDQNSEGQFPPAILQFLRGLFPGGEIHVESVNSQETATEPEPEPEPELTTTNSTVAQEAESSVTEEGLYLSRLLQQVMPLIPQDAGTEQNVVRPGEGDSTQQRDGSASSQQPENSEVRTSRRRDDPNAGPANSKRQKME